MVFYEEKMMAQEPGLHRLILQRTDIPVPKIIFYDSDHDIFKQDVLLMQRLPGHPASEAPFLTSSMWQKVLYQVGAYLKQLHSIQITKFGYCGPHNPMQPQFKWVDAFEIMWKKMIEQIMKMGAYSQSQGEYLISRLKEQQQLFDKSISASLLHMDIWAQNILVNQEGSVTGLLDWDRALYGDPEIEYAVLDYCGISEPAFWRGYDKSRPRSKEADIRHAFYMLYEIQKYIIINGLRRNDKQRALYYRDYALAYSRENL